MPASRATIHEVDFCAQIASSANAIIATNPPIFPFSEARVEGFGVGAARSRRKDLRFFDRNRRLLLCGEVKLPGTREGQSAFNQKLVADAAAKADDAGVQYFFTWNVNEFILWDRAQWDRPWFERRVRTWRLARNLSNAADVAREDNLNFIKTHFLPDLLRDLADIISGRRLDWSMPPDDVFIRSLESHLNWPVRLASEYILENSRRKRVFDLRVQRWMTDQDWTFVRTPEEEWAKAVDNMAKTLAYVWANRLIFYKALRARFLDLPRLEILRSAGTADAAVESFNRLFQRAVERSGDYEPLLMPDARDWATKLVFQPPNALDAWRGLLRGIESVDFREVPSDVVGRIFQKLIGPEERHRYGQHFTGDDVVDLINGFCIRSASDAILDPACGSGSFLVRAYYRKRNLNARRPHLDLIGELFGCDIATYPAHLATLNLAAREINDEANYPRIARRNFFDFEPSDPFCHVPDGAGGQIAVRLPALDAIVGNPPYVRQEKVEKDDKTKFSELATAAWPDLRLSGRSDLHCYFWPAAAQFLKDDGFFGFLTSSSWLDVEYGFALQGWILRHFRVLAIMESAAEPWFEDARVKTCVTILQRCDDETQRMENIVRFVRFERKLAEIIGFASGQSEPLRQGSIEALRQRILRRTADHHDADMRIIVKTQRDLWDDGVRAASILDEIEPEPAAVDQEDDVDDETAESAEDVMNGIRATEGSPYRAGKWGRYVRAPDIYFEIMRRFGDRFVALGEVANIRRGITSGCDAFFMPKDVTGEMLDRYATDREFRRNTGGAPRSDVASGKLKIIQAGDGTVHPIEAKYVAPEIHSLMKVERPVIRAADLNRVVLMVSEELPDLKANAPWTWRYIRYGMTTTFTSAKSKAVPIPQRSTCAAREPWYDLTGLVKPGIALWPMAQQYRHIIAGNPERLICNHNLFDVAPISLSRQESAALVAILNSTIVGLFKTFYGRFAGTEGNLKTEVVDVNLLEVADPRNISSAIAGRMRDALASMSRREVGRLVEEQLMDCHSPERARRIAAGPLVFAKELQQSDRRELDDAVLELLGVSDPDERAVLLGRLYQATAQHFRQIRVVEIEKMEQRAKTNARRFTVHDLAADIWDAAELEDATPLAEWIRQRPESTSAASIPEERPVYLSDDVMFSPNVVYFGRARSVHMECTNRAQAELVARLADLGLTGELTLPADLAPCFQLLARVNERIDRAMARLTELTESRTSDDRMRERILELLQRWYTVGRENSARQAPADD